jgi:hypothetical protein
MPAGTDAGATEFKRRSLLPTSDEQWLASTLNRTKAIPKIL